MESLEVSANCPFAEAVSDVSSQSILILSPKAPLAIERHPLRSADVLILQDIDKKSNSMKLKYVSRCRCFTPDDMKQGTSDRHTRHGHLGMASYQNDEHVCQAPRKKAISFG
jgi:hypothetical protein